MRESTGFGAFPLIAGDFEIQRSEKAGPLSRIDQMRLAGQPSKIHSTRAHPTTPKKIRDQQIMFQALERVKG